MGSDEVPNGPGWPEDHHNLSTSGSVVKQNENQAETHVVNRINGQQKDDTTPASEVENNVHIDKPTKDGQDDEDFVPRSRLAKYKRVERPRKRQSTLAQNSDTSSPPSKRPKKFLRTTGAPQEMKEEFEQEKQEILDEVPEAVKAKFGSIGFFKWNSYYQPLLILSPYQVPPGPMRDQWMKMFQNLKRTNRLQNLTYLVYFYGSTNLDTCYSLLPKNKVVSWEEAESKKLHDVPDKIRAKLSSGKTLSKAEQEVSNAYAEMKEDIDKAATDRQRWVVDSSEIYDRLDEADTEA